MDNPSWHPRRGSNVLNDSNRNWPFLGLTKRKKGCRRAFTCALFQRRRRFELLSFWVEVQPCYSFSLLLCGSLYGGFSFWYTGRDALNLKGCETSLPLQWTGGMSSSGNDMAHSSWCCSWCLTALTVCTQHSEKPTSTCPPDVGSRCVTADGSYSAGNTRLISPLMSYMRRIVSLSFIWLYNKSAS